MTRPDGSLPPAAGPLTQDPYLRARRRAALNPHLRARLDNQRFALVQQLNQLDTETTDWLQRRRTLLAQAIELHDTLWPPQPHGWTRRPPKPGARWMPPLPEPARPLNGWALRTTCHALLQRFGPLALPEIHALLHRYGYKIDARHPVKALADALGYEVLQRRAQRLHRGIYTTLLEPEPIPRDLDPTLNLTTWRTGTFRQRARHARPDGRVASRGNGRVRTKKRRSGRRRRHRG